jgi:hypothetical protein
VRISNPGGVAGEGSDHCQSTQYMFITPGTHLELDGFARKLSYMLDARFPFEASF